MKICWDNLKGVYFTRNGFLRKGTITYIYKESCTKCGEPYLTENSRQSGFCSKSCVLSGKNHYLYGKTHTIGTKKKLSKSRQYRVGKLGSCWKGEVTKIGLTTYNTYENRLGPYEDICKQKDTEVLEVRCAYCNRRYAPKLFEIKNRLKAINSLDKGEQRLYCSENCKQACPTYKKIKYPNGFKHTSSREVSTYLRQMVFERDNWTCQICGKTSKEVQLHCHHTDPVAQNPMFQNDMDSCITLCKECHKKVHKQYGCRYVDLRCKKILKIRSI